MLFELAFVLLSKSGMVFLVLLCKTNYLLPIPLHSMFVQLLNHKWSSEGLYVKGNEHWLLHKSVLLLSVLHICSALAEQIFKMRMEGDTWFWSLVLISNAGGESSCWSLTATFQVVYNGEVVFQNKWIACFNMRKTKFCRTVLSLIWEPCGLGGIPCYVVFILNPP